MDNRAKLDLPYYKVAKQCLMNWGNAQSNWVGLSEQEADEIILTQSFDEIDPQVDAAYSINCAIDGILGAFVDNQVFPLDYELEKKNLSDFVYNGGESKIVDELKRINETSTTPKSAERIIHNIVLIALYATHDGWVEKESNKKKFMKRDSKFQHMPLELIGWEEVKKDLLFIKPIFEKIGIEINEELLEQLYNQRVESFVVRQHDLHNSEDLAKLISQGENFYPSLAGYSDEALDLINNKPEIVVESIETKGIGKIEDIRKQYEVRKSIMKLQGKSRKADDAIRLGEQAEQGTPTNND